MKALGFGIALAVMLNNPVLAGDYKNIATRPYVLLSVGQSIDIHSVRDGGCKNIAPTWKYTRRLLPRVKLGIFEDGGAGWRYDNTCRKFMKVRAVNYRAKKPGKEIFMVLGQMIQVTIPKP